MRGLPKPANCNELSLERIQDTLDWVRPVFKAMKAAAIPDPVCQKVMTYLLKELDKEIGQ